MTKEKVLITGGAGYIGSVLTGHLLEEGYKVTCLDNLHYRQDSLFHLVYDENFNFLYGDVRDERVIKEIVPQFDVIIPLAAIVGMPAAEKKVHDTISINRNAITMLNNFRDKGQKLIFPTTNSGYGTKSGEMHCTEETPLEPISLYGKTKVETEKYLLESEKDAITLRLATLFGFSQRMRTDLIVNDFVLKAMRDRYLVVYQPHYKRNFLHVRDAARCFEHCIENYDSMKNLPYNVGLDGENLSKLELLERIKKHVPKLEIILGEIGEDPDKRNYIISNDRIISTKFQTKFSLDHGIRELIRGYNVLLSKNIYGNA